MNPHKKNGFTVVEFLITGISIFCGFYFLFWTCYLGANTMLARFYLNDFALCQLNSKPNECLQNLKQRLSDLRFVEIKKIDVQTSLALKTVSLIYNFNLPIIGLKNGLQAIHISSQINLGDWQ